ncbi:MAG: hypothetical protein ACREQ5_13045 [Candidatus Dormibacteria bacterium]
MIDGGIETYRTREALSDSGLAVQGLRRIRLRSPRGAELSNSGYHRQGLCWWTADCTGYAVYIGSIRGDDAVDVTAYVPLAAGTRRLRVGSPRKGKPHDHYDGTVAI